MMHFIKPEYLVSLHMILNESLQSTETDLMDFCGKLNIALKASGVEAVFLWSDKYVDEMLNEYDSYFGRFETITANPSYIYSKVSLDTLSEQFVAYLSTDVFKVAMQFKKERTMATKEMIEIMQAYENGKLIEFRHKNPGEDDTWKLVPTPSWDWVSFDYRIKPKDSYRPYKDSNEFRDHWNTMTTPGDTWQPVKDSLFQGVWLKDKTTGGIEQVLGCSGKLVHIGFGNCSFDEMLNFYTYLDGTPFGIKE